MWNQHAQQHYTRSRSHSFSNHTRQPAVHDSRRAHSPAFPAPPFEQALYHYPTAQPPISSSPGGFLVPQLGAGPPLPPPPLSDRGRQADRGFDLPREHGHRHHSHSHSHAQEPTHHKLHHKHKHHHGHHSHRHSHSQSNYPNVTIHTNGQAMPVPWPSQQPGPVAPSMRPAHHVNYNSHSHSGQQNMTDMNSPTPMRMPVPHTPPREAQYYGPGNEHEKNFFQYSLCTGRRKALCVGINYVGQPHELNGCVNDAKRIRRFLIDRYGFKSGDIVLLTDDGKTARELPTKKNMEDAMRWLVRDAHPHDSLVFHYSGHGGQTKDLDGDESDGYDEVIYPVDFNKYGHIVDDDMHSIMVKPLPAGCRLTAIFDCCHSGSALDLPYMYGTGGKLKKEPNLSRAVGGNFTDSQGFGGNNINSLTRAFDGLMRRGDTGRHAVAYTGLVKTSPADVISWSGCTDSQTSADTYEAGSATGAMSYAFMKTLKEKPDQSYQELLSNIRKILKSQFSQKPQLSSSHPIDTKIKFLM